MCLTLNKLITSVYENDYVFREKYNETKYNFLKIVKRYKPYQISATMSMNSFFLYYPLVFTKTKEIVIFKRNIKPKNDLTNK